MRLGTYFAREGNSKEKEFGEITSEEHTSDWSQSKVFLVYVS